MASITPDQAPRPIRLTVLISGNGTNLQALIDASHRTVASSSTADSDSSSPPPSFPHPTIITHVISNRSSAFGLQRAQTAKPSITTSTHLLSPYKALHPATTEGLATARSAYDADLASLILGLSFQPPHATSKSTSTPPSNPTSTPNSMPKPKPDIVVLAGFMHILTPSFLQPLATHSIPVLNLHPALPGQFDGAHAIERAADAAAKGEIHETGVMVHHVIAEVDRGTPVIVRRIAVERADGLEGIEAKVRSIEGRTLVEGVGIVVKALWDRRKETLNEVGKNSNVGSHRKSS